MGADLLAEVGGGDAVGAVGEEAVGGRADPVGVGGGVQALCGSVVFDGAADHVVVGAQDGWTGAAIFGFEDLVGGGDADYQDVVFSIRAAPTDLIL